MNTKQLADVIGIHPDSVRRWSKEFRQFFSPTATPEKGTARQFTRHDAAVMLYVATARKNSVSGDTIAARLAEMQGNRWAGLPEAPPEWFEPPGDDSMPVSLAASKAYDVAQLAVLQNELNHVRTALETSESRVKALEADLSLLRASESTTAGKIHALELDLERARGETEVLRARLASYAITGGQPLSVLSIALAAMLAGAVLVAAALVLARLLL